MPDYAHQTSQRRTQQLNGQAEHARKSVVSDGEPGRYLILGRVVADGSKRWDVFRYQDNRKPKLEGRDFVWAEEAVSFVEEQRRGRQVFAAGSLRGRFKKPGAVWQPAVDLAVVKGDVEEMRMPDKPFYVV